MKKLIIILFTLFCLTMSLSHNPDNSSNLFADSSTQHQTNGVVEDDEFSS